MVLLFTAPTRSKPATPHATCVPPPTANQINAAVAYASCVCVFPLLSRLERNLEDVREDLSTARASLGETEALRDEATAAAAEAGARLQTSEEQLLRSRREHDLLQAERSVWQVARSGIQEELAKVRNGC